LLFTLELAKVDTAVHKGLIKTVNFFLRAIVVRGSVERNI